MSVSTLTQSTSPRAAASPSIRIDRLDPAERAKFPHEPVLVEHGLVEEPLLEIESILDLIERIDAKHTDWHVGDVPIDMRGRPPKTDLSARETLARIATCNAWLGVDKMQVDPTYAALVHRVVADVQAALPRAFTGIHQREGNLFVSSPGARKPYHIDPEHNFLLQIRGTKTVRLWDRRKEEVLSEATLEAFSTTDDWAGIEVSAEGRPADYTFELRPGIGLYFPVQWPHDVQNGTEEASTSLSVTFRSAGSRRDETIRQFNAKLRRRGFSPTGPGRSAWRDALKAGFMNTARGVKGMFGRG